MVIPSFISKFWIRFLKIVMLYLIYDYLEIIVHLFSGILSCFQFGSLAQSCLTACNPMDCSTPGLPVHHQLPESTQTHVH